MIKRIITFFLAALMLACGVVTFAACSSTAEGQEEQNVIKGQNKVPEKGEFYTLQEAYDCGLLTQDDLKVISERRFLVSELDEEIAYQIRMAIVSKKKNTNLEEVFITVYLGTFGDYIVFQYNDGKQYPQVLLKETIGGVEIYHGYPAPLVWVKL